MYSSRICVEGLPRTTKKKEYIVSGLEQRTLHVRRRSAKRPADNVPLHSAFVSLSLLAAMKTYFNTYIPCCSFMLGIAIFLFDCYLKICALFQEVLGCRRSITVLVTVEVWLGLAVC